MKKMANLLKFLGLNEEEYIKSGEKIEEQTCPVCKVELNLEEAKCVDGHRVILCGLSKKVIYEDAYYQCKLCQLSISSEILQLCVACNIHFNDACPRCCNLLKRVY